MADLKFTGERIVPQADNCEPTFAQKMYQEHAARYLFASQLVHGRSVLDVGCGVGYGSQILAEKGAARVLAFDLSMEAIAHARRHYAHPVLTFEVESAELFDFGERFDVVTCFELIEHVNDYKAVFDRIAAALKPNGLVVMSTPRALEEKRTHFHTKEFSLVEFRQLFRTRFKRHHFYFENNHFASLIADRRPTSIDGVEPLQDQYNIDLADYFVVVASPSAKAQVDALKPVIALNDDRYVLNLERDVGILHRAEDNLRQQLIDREAELAQARSAHASASHERDALQRSADSLRAEMMASAETVARAQQELDVLRQQVQSTLTQLAAAEDAVAEVRAEAARATATIAELKAGLAARENELALERNLGSRRDAALAGIREELKCAFSESAALQAQLRSAEVQVAELGARLAAREDAVAELRALLSRADEQSRVREQALSLMSQQSELLRSRLESAESLALVRDEEHRRTLADAAQQIEIGRTDLADAQRALGAQSTEYRRALEQAEAGARQLDLVQSELASLRVSSQYEISALARDLAGERAERAKVEADLAVTRASASAIEAEKSALAADVESLRVQLGRAAAEAAYLTRLVEMMRESRSWKLTSPLRNAANLARTTKLYARRAGHYREVNGTWALLRAVARKVRRRIVGAPVKVDIPKAFVVLPPTEGPSPATEVVAVSDAPSTEISGTDDRPALDGVEMFIGCWEGESKRYRVHNVAAALGIEGVRVAVKPFAELPLLATEGRKPKVVVVFRSPYDSAFGVEAFFEYARRAGIKVVFDIDDLVFDPDIVHMVDAFHGLSDSEKALYMDGVHKYRRMLLESDLVTVTTDYLVDEVRKLGKNATIVRNSINAEQLEVADRVLKARVAKSHGQPVVIGYFSGSRTHQKDFAQAERALLRVMSESTNVRLLIVGFLDLGDAWCPFEDRIERQGFLPYLEMLEVLGRCDINVAPLEVGNPFCESKSELKYFEAAIVQVPTVASATAPFKAAIESGANGFIAEDEDEWYCALTSLVADSELRECIGRAARASAIERFGPRAVARQALDAYGLDAPPQRQRSTRERLRIDWVIPPIIVGGGGHRNIFRAAHHLQEFGHDVHLHIANMNETDEQLARIIQENFYPFKGHVRRYDCSFERTDVVFATHWSTVDAALRAKDLAREIMYFVQDFEPAFAPMGSEYVLAENTYRLGLYHVTSGPWCERILRSQFGAAADHFRFPIDKEIYFPRPRTVTNKRLVFFAKPEMPRRCFELGVLALRQVKAMRPDVEIVMFGSPHAAKQNLDFPVTFLKVVPTLDGLAELYSNCDAGMVFSTTNPSLVPYEMMACGLPVIDLDRPGNEVNYDDRRDIALLANPLPDVMAQQVVELLDSSEQRQMRSRNGLEFAAGFPTEAEMARRIESLIINRLRTKGMASAALIDTVAGE